MKSFQQIREGLKIRGNLPDTGSNKVVIIAVTYYRGSGWKVEPLNENEFEVTDVDGFAEDEWHRLKKTAMEQAKDLQKKYPKAKIVTRR